MKISIIATIYNDSLVVAELCRQIFAHIETSVYRGADLELILVNDCSPDDSWQAIQNVAATDTRIKGVSIGRNVGQQMAVSAGLDYAEGDVVIVMDGDLQNPPDTISTLIKNIENGHDVVITTSRTRNNFRDELSSTLFWFVVKYLLKIDIVPHQLMLKAFSRRFVLHFRKYREKIRVVAGIVNDIGLKQTVIRVDNRRRTSGRSSYNFTKRISLFLDIIVGLSLKPLDFLIYLGMFGLFLGFALLVRTIFQYVTIEVLPGYTSILSLVCFFGGSSLFALGIIGRYLSNIYTEVRMRPLYIEQATVNL